MITTNLFFIGIAISLFSITLALSKRPHQISDKIFIAMLLSIIFPMMIALTNSTELKEIIFIRRIRDYMPLTLAPFVAIYAQSLVQSNFKFGKTSLYHFLPFALFYVVSLALDPFISFDSFAENSYKTDPFRLPFAIVFFASIGCYAIWIPNLLKEHRNNMMDFYATNPSHVSLNWLTWVVYVGFLLFAIAHVPEIIDALNLAHPDAFVLEVSRTIRALGFVVFLCVMSFFGVKQTQVSLESEPHQAPRIGQTIAEVDKKLEIQSLEGAQIEEQKAKPRSPVIQDALLDQYLIKLEEFVQAEKPYLDSELTLGSLAEMIDIPKHHLTETLNRKLEKNFYCYINEYRLEELKPLLVDPKLKSQSILTLAYEAGFNSKTTFNSFFKKATSMTPSQFRKAGSAQNQLQAV